MAGLDFEGNQQKGRSGQTGCPIMSNAAPIHLDLVSPSQERGWALLQAVQEKGLIDFSDLILQA